MSSFFEELKRCKAELFTKEMLSYIDNLVDAFDDTNIDADPILVDMLEATEVDIHSIVDLKDELGHGRAVCGHSAQANMELYSEGSCEALGRRSQ